MRISGLLGPLGVYVTVNQLAATRAGRKIAGAGFTIIGITVWVLPAAVSTTAHPGITSLWVILGGALCMGGIALRFGPDRAIQAPYFDEAGIASTPSSPRRKGNRGLEWHGRARTLGQFL